jgi:hypothetical protein
MSVMLLSFNESRNQVWPVGVGPDNRLGHGGSRRVSQPCSARPPFQPAKFAFGFLPRSIAGR